MNLRNMPIGLSAPRVVRAVIEIPKGGLEKIEYNPKSREFHVDRRLSAPMPVAYGFIPSTMAEDQDAVDVMVVTSRHLKTGDVLNVRPVGILYMTHGQVEDPKILAVPVEDSPRDLNDIQSGILREITKFFEQDNRVRVRSWGFRSGALDEIRKRTFETVHLGHLLSDPKKLILGGIALVAVPLLVYFLGKGGSDSLEAS